MPLMSLTTYPLAPANIASSIASSEVNDVSIRHRRFGSRDKQLPAQFDAIAVWQPHVEDRDVGLKGGYPRQRLCHRSGLADDLEFGVRAEEVDESPSDDLVVIDEKDFHHSKALRRRRRDGGCVPHNMFWGSQISTEHSALCSAA